MASDVLAVMDELHLDQTAFVGWSDGACTALILAMNAPARVAGVFFFACNMDPSGVKNMVEPNPIVNRCFRRHAVCPQGRGLAQVRDHDPRRDRQAIRKGASVGAVAGGRRARLDAAARQRVEDQC